MNKRSLLRSAATLLILSGAHHSFASSLPAAIFLSAGPNIASVGVPSSNDLSTREQAIEREFACINSRKESNQGLDWESVCYTPSQRTERNSRLVELSTKPVTFEIGTDLYYFTYEEPIFDLEDKGFMYGIFGTYTLRPAEDDGLNMDVIDFYQMEGRFNYGKVDYESTPSGTIDGITDYTFEARLLLGKDIPLHQQFLFTPFMGLAYRYLNDDTGGMQSSTGAYGYERESRYFYLPLGAELAAQVTNDWKITFKGEYDVFLQGEQTSKLSDIAGYPDLENEQEEGFGYRFSAKLSYATEKYEFFVEPFYRYWHIQDSNLATASGSVFIVTGYEPENKSSEIGGRIGIKF